MAKDNHHPAYYPYLFSIAGAGLTVLGLAIVRLAADGSGYQWVFLALLTVLLSAFPIKIPQISYMLSIEDTLVFTNLILFGSEAGVITAALQGVMGSVRAKSVQRRAEFILFNASALILGAYLSGRVFFSFHPVPIHRSPPAAFIHLFVPTALMALVYYLINSVSVAVVISLDLRKRVYEVWQQNFSWTWITYVAGATVAAIIGANIKSNAFGLIAAVIPFVLITLFTYRTYRDRVESQFRQIRELNALYLRTVESMALAVEAKDQTTHGHIRRVRVYSVGLSRLCGIEDKNQLLAIETAALLHDIGKLAIEDFILNKPGKLSSQEYERIKQHSAAGEEIVKQIEFPFPAAECVRSHHERWDGTGYPDGLKNKDIPLGSRILAIADVYDALRSPRPYKQPMNTAEAILELRRDSGAVFDPTLVELFINHVEELEAEAERAARDMPQLQWQHCNWRSSPVQWASAEIKPYTGADNAAELIALQEFCQAYGRTLPLSDILLNLECRLKRLLPFETCIFFLSREDDVLEAAHVCGKMADVLRDFRIEYGKGISGWVAAYVNPMVNSDPALDFKGLTGDFSCFGCSLIVPMLNGKSCVGTISLYSVPDFQYNDSHLSTLRIVSNQVAPLLAEAMRRRAAPEEEHQADPVTGLHGIRYLSVAGQQLIEACSRQSVKLQLLNIRIKNLPDLVNLYGPPARDWILRNVARALLGEIRETDLLARFGLDGFVVLITPAKPVLFKRRAAQLRELVSKIRFHQGALLECDLGAANFPEDGDSIFTLLEVARQSSMLPEEGQAEGIADTAAENVLEFPTGTMKA